MVDAQTVGVLVTATSVTIAAIYYVMTFRVQQTNMKNTLETRRIGLVDSISIRTLDENGIKSYLELLNYEWRDYDDFEKKYGSDFNVEAAAKRYSFWDTYNLIGAMLRKGIIDADDLYDTGLGASTFLWNKYKPIVEEVRKRYWGQGFLRDFEYLAGEMLKVSIARDPSYVLPETGTKYSSDK